MKVKFAIKERENGGKVEIELPSGKLFMITVWDDTDGLIVQSVDGSMLIQPCVSNEIKIFVT